MYLCIIFGDINAKLSDLNTLINVSDFLYPLQASKERITIGHILEVVCKKINYLF